MFLSLTWWSNKVFHTSCGVLWALASLAFGGAEFLLEKNPVSKWLFDQTVCLLSMCFLKEPDLANLGLTAQHILLIKRYLPKYSAYTAFLVSDKHLQNVFLFHDELCLSVQTFQFCPDRTFYQSIHLSIYLSVSLLWSQSINTKKGKEKKEKEKCPLGIQRTFQYKHSIVVILIMINLLFASSWCTAIV